MKKILIIILFIILLISGCAESEQEPSPTNANGTAVIVQSVDGAGNLPLVDNEIPGVGVFFDGEHWAGHNGLVYSQWFDTNLNTGQNISYLLCNDNATHFHLTNTHLGSSAGPIRAEFWEKPTITNNGTQQNLTRTNRGVEYINITPGVTYYISPTITDYGTLLYTDWLLGTNNKAENIFSLAYEWIFEHNECYLLNIVNENGNNVFIHGAFSGINVEAHN